MTQMTNDHDAYDYAVLVCLRPTNQVIHIVLYEKPPTKIDLRNLRRELKEDEEFGIQDLIDECQFKVINKNGDIIS